MKKINMHLLSLFTLISLTLCDDVLSNEQVDEILRKTFQVVWQEAMAAKTQVSQAAPQLREELLENLCSSAPAVNFTTHADLSDSLTQAENTSASVFVSMDNQNSWISNDTVLPLNEEGYENTWGATTITEGGNNVHWYLQGSIDSGSLGLDFGQLTISQSPYNQNDVWPPSDNLYANIVDDESGDNAGGGSGQDITNLRATYSDNKLYASTDIRSVSIILNTL